MFASRIVRAEPIKLPLAIFLMNFGTSMCVGHACVHGASKQYKHLFASGTAACLSKAGCRSGKRNPISGLAGDRSRKFVDSLIVTKNLHAEANVAASFRRSVALKRKLYPCGFRCSSNTFLKSRLCTICDPAGVSSFDTSGRMRFHPDQSFSRQRAKCLYRQRNVLALRVLGRVMAKSIQ